jgi:hypothetical protein
MNTFLTILFFAIGLAAILLFINPLTGKKLLKGFEVKLFIIAKYAVFLLLILIAISKIWNIQ